MLQAMRDGAQSRLIKFILFGILILAGLGLVLSDVGGFFRGGVAPSVAFEVDGAPFSAMELDRQVSEVLRSQGLTPEQGIRLGLVNEVMKAEINRRLLQKEGFSQGLRVSDAIIARDTQRLIDTYLASFGENLPRDVFFRQFLSAMGITEQQYVFSKKEEITAGLLSNAFIRTSIAPQKITQFLNAYENEKRTAVTYFVAPDTIAKPDDKTLEAYFNANSQNYTKPEYRRFSVATLKYDALREETDISEERLKEEYNARLASYSQPETRTVVQAFADDEETALKIYEAAKKDGLKKASTDVLGHSANFIPASEFTRDGLPQNFAEPIFSAKQGELSKPFKTDFGWYVILVESVTEPKTKSFDSVKTELKNELQYTEATGNIYSIADIFEDAIAGGSSLKEAAQEANIPVVEYGFIDANSISENGKSGFNGSASILKAVFEGFEGETSNMIEERNGDIHFVFVDEIKPAAPLVLKDIRDRVEADYLRTERRQSSAEKAITLLDELRAGKTPVTLKEHKAVTSSETTADLSGDAVAVLFLELSKKGDFTSIPSGDGQLIVGLKDVSVSLTSASSKEENNSALNAEMRNDILGQYFSALRTKTKVKVNDKVVENIFSTRLDYQ